MSSIAFRAHTERARLIMSPLSVLAPLAAAATPAHADSSEKSSSPLLTAIWEDASLVAELAPTESASTEQNRH